MALGFYVNMDHCIGCRTCQVACKDRHDLQTVGVRPRRVESYEAGAYPDVHVFHTSISCNHCEDPACVKSCPTGAMHRADDGTIVHDDSRCVLCKMCIVACPYGAPQHDTVKDMIVKCDSCKDLRDARHEPNCVAACPMRAIEFGDMDELRAKHGNDTKSELPVIAPAHYTHPNLLVKAAPGAERKDVQQVTL